jgi:serine/threonine-protein kinase
LQDRTGAAVGAPGQVTGLGQYGFARPQGRLHLGEKRHGAAARFYADAFAAEPKLGTDLGAAHRYKAACAAVLAGCGAGSDDDKLDEKEKTQLRGQALAWLRADLAAWTKEMAKNTHEAHAAVQQKMRHWQADPDLAGVRGAAALARLPEAEWQPWQKLWDDAAETLARAQAQERASPKKPAAAR